MSSRWKCRNTRRRSSSSTFWPIRPERCRKNIRLTAWTTTTPHSAPTITISVCAEPPSMIGGMPMVDTALHEHRNRKARNVFHHDDDGEQRDRPPIRPQQRAEQRAGFPPARQRLVDRQVVVAVLVEPAPPAVDRLLVRFLRYVDGRWCRSRSSALGLRRREATAVPVVRTPRRSASCSS